MKCTSAWGHHRNEECIPDEICSDCPQKIVRSLLAEALGLLRVVEREMDNSTLPLRIAAFLARCKKEGISLG